MRSADARITFLERLQREGITEEYYLASGRYGPLVDAVAAGDFESARRIAELSPDALQLGEYDDDYHYAQALHRLVQGDPPVDEVESIADDLETFLNGEPSARLDVVRALIRRDQDAFDRAFEDLIYDFEESVRKAKERAQLEEPTILAQRVVFVEGLAILKLAQMQRLETASEYPYCPSLARRPMQVPLKPLPI